MKDASDYYKTERCFYPTSPNLMLTPKPGSIDFL